MQTLVAVFGRIIQLDVEESDTIGTIKRMVHEHNDWSRIRPEGIHPDQSRLLFKGEELEDDRLVSDLNINELGPDDVIPHALQFTMPEGVIKTPLQHSFPIFVQTLWGKAIVLKLWVNATDTIADVKAQFQDKTAIPTHNTCLIFAGKQLEAGVPLARYNVHKKCKMGLWWGPLDAGDLERVGLQMQMQMHTTFRANGGFI